MKHRPSECWHLDGAGTHPSASHPLWLAERVCSVSIMARFLFCAVPICGTILPRMRLVAGPVPFKPACVVPSKPCCVQVRGYVSTLDERPCLKPTGEATHSADLKTDLAVITISRKDYHESGGCNTNSSQSVRFSAQFDASVERLLPPEAQICVEIPNLVIWRVACIHKGTDDWLKNPSRLNALHMWLPRCCGSPA